MDIIAFQKTIEKRNKEAWLRSSLINISGRLNKFVPDN